MVLVTATLGFLAILSLILLLWQWIVAMRFPLHERVSQAAPTPVTLLKPLKGADPDTERCLRSWFTQRYSGPLQILFGVASAGDPACEIVRKLLKEYSATDADLIICGPLRGANAKVSKLIQLQKAAKHNVLVISDADVCAPGDLVSEIVARLGGGVVGLANCFYSLANPATLAMQWEAIAINADFWSQVLQAQSLKPLDFALGAVMATTRQQLGNVGGFEAFANCLADDYQLGHCIARNGQRVVLSTVPVQCFSEPMGWRAVWKHQLRWARTIRVSQPVPYFLSILSNPTLWPLIWLLAKPAAISAIFAAVAGSIRVLSGLALQSRLTREKGHFRYWWLILAKDLLQTAIWFAAFAGNTIEWRGQKMKLLRNGELAVMRDG